MLRAQIEERSADDGLLDVLLFTPDASPIDAALEAAGHMPLPPYLHRADEDEDRERYQTVFARVKGAVTAPTAGLHLSNDLLDRLEKKGVLRASVTLHVGLGTFQPVTVEDFDDHPMHTESYEVPEATARAIDAARARGAPVLAVGTTVVRALESAAIGDRPEVSAPAQLRRGSSSSRGTISRWSTSCSPLFTCCNRRCWRWFPRSRGESACWMPIARPSRTATVSSPMAMRC